MQYWRAPQLVTWYQLVIFNYGVSGFSRDLFLCRQYSTQLYCCFSVALHSRRPPLFIFSSDVTETYPFQGKAHNEKTPYIQASYHIGLWLFDRCIALSLYLVVAVLTVCNFLDLE